MWIVKAMFLLPVMVICAGIEAIYSIKNDYEGL
jgi:hypothetical protein